METHQLVQLGVGSILGATGLSHALASAAWGKLIGDLARLSYGGLIIGLTAFLTGLVVVLLHNRWVLAPGLLVTILGWAWLAKGLIYLIYPELLGRVARGAIENPKKFRPIGWIMLAVGIGLLAEALWPIV